MLKSIHVICYSFASNVCDMYGKGLLFSLLVIPMPSIYRAWQLCFKMAVTLAHTKNEETGHNIVYSM